MNEYYYALIMENAYEYNLRKVEHGWDSHKGFLTEVTEEAAKQIVLALNEKNGYICPIAPVLSINERYKL